MKITALKLATILCLGLPFVSCKNQKIIVNDGAYVTNDGTKDGLSHVQTQYKDAVKTDDGIRITLGSDVLFETNSSFLSASAKQELDKFVDLLKTYNTDYSLAIEGHTDATGTAEYNLQLSEKRANSVKAYLVSKKIASSKIQVNGLGITKPIAPNNTVEGRKKNRRVEIIIRNSDLR